MAPAPQSLALAVRRLVGHLPARVPVSICPRRQRARGRRNALFHPRCHADGNAGDMESSVSFGALPEKN